MAFSMFFFASSRCSAGDPVSDPGAEDSPLVIRDGRIAISSAFYVRLSCRSLVRDILEIRYKREA